jgi:hypothetical protein
MRVISIQVQPERAKAIDMTAVSRVFESIAARADLVHKHSFGHGGEGEGVYYNFTFGTPSPSLLWSLIWQSLYESPDFGAGMKASSMAMCSAPDGWHTYTQLYHFEPEVPRGAI